MQKRHAIFVMNGHDQTNIRGLKMVINPKNRYGINKVRKLRSSVVIMFTDIEEYECPGKCPI